MTGRSALSESLFASEVRRRNITSLEYSTAFYWSDLIFHTHDVIVPNLQDDGIVVYDRYDLSILTYHEAYGLCHDDLLLDEYVKRDMILCPDVTVFLDPPVEIALTRIIECVESSDIDRAFIDAPQLLALIQARMKYHLERTRRRYIALDTSQMSIAHCVDRILAVIKLTQQ